MNIIKYVCSRALSESRRKIYYNSPSRRVVPAQIVSGAYPGEYYQYGNYVTFPGQTLSATPGIWEDDEGTPIVTGEWVDWYGNPVGEKNQYNFTVPLSTPVNIGYIYIWRETVTQGTLSAEWYDFHIQVISEPGPPTYYGTTTPISGTHYPGEIVIKPTYRWGSSYLNIETSGEWYKNDEPTGVSTDTYSDTQNGDTLFWRESAFDGINYGFSNGKPSSWESLSAYDWYGKFLVDSTLYDSISDIKNQIDTRIDDLSGGKLHMKRFSVKDHANSVYEWNPDGWFYDIRDQLTGASAYKTGIIRGPEDSGGILITPRHLLFCEHSRPWAGGTWPVNYNDTRNMTHRFVLEDNSVVDCVQIHQAASKTADLCVAVLDKNVEELGVHVCPIMPYDRLEWETILPLSKEQLSSFPLFAISQGYNTNIINEPWSLPVSDYDYPDHDVLVYIVDWHNKRQNINTRVPPVSTYMPFNYAVYQGDSGTPAFVLVNGTVYLYCILTTVWAGRIAAQYIDEINSLIIQADQNAINMGRLDSPTGYTVSRAPNPFSP